VSRPASDCSTAISTAELQAALECVLSEREGSRVRVAHVDRRPSEYRSSFAIEELDVHLDDGRPLRLVWKDVSRRALSAEASDAKPEFLYDPRREIETYRLIVSQSELGTPRYFGAIVDAKAERYWLFLERVSGLELSQVGDVSIWHEVARWLARLHNLFTADSLRPEERHHLLVHDRRSFGLWIGRACEYLRRREPNPSPSELERIDRLAERYDRVAARLAELPTSLIHGDFFASNILIDSSSSSLRICPVDWEMSATGPRWLDLAALVAGHWTDDQRRSLAMAYYSESKSHAGPSGDTDAFLTGLQLCRLHLAVQMLGWSGTWRPQPSHAYDWLAEALRLVDELGIA
jgi:aminoglycoside phosphotransferase (APT) family kinase protein